MSETELKTDAEKVAATVKADTHKVVALAKRAWETTDLAIVGIVALLIGLFVGHHFRF